MNEPTEAQVWTDILGYEGLYQLNQVGDVRSLERTVKFGSHTRKVGGYNLAQPLDFHGRPIVRLASKGKMKTWRVHILVAMIYLGPKPKGAHVHHKDTNMTNNDVSNLEYIDGVKHMRLHKKGKPGSVRGTRHGQAKLNPDVVQDARRRHATGETFAFLARENGVDPESMMRAIRGITWGHI